MAQTKKKKISVSAADDNTVKSSKPEKDTDSINEYKDKKTFGFVLRIIIFSIIALFLYLCFLGACKGLGVIMGGLFFGIFGWIAWLLPLDLIISYAYIREKGDQERSKRIRQTIGINLMILSLEAVIQLGTAEQTLMDYYRTEHESEDNFLRCLYASFSDIMNGGKGNGGIICDTLNNFFIYVTGSAGAVLFWIALAMIACYIAFGREILAAIREENSYNLEMEDKVRYSKENNGYKEPDYSLRKFVGGRFSRRKSGHDEEYYDDEEADFSDDEAYYGDEDLHDNDPLSYGDEEDRPRGGFSRKLKKSLMNDTSDKTDRSDNGYHADSRSVHGRQQNMGVQSSGKAQSLPDEGPVIGIAGNKNASNTFPEDNTDKASGMGLQVNILSDEKEGPDILFAQNDEKVQKNPADLPDPENINAGGDVRNTRDKYSENAARINRSLKAGMNCASSSAGPSKPGPLGSGDNRLNNNTDISDQKQSDDSEMPVISDAFKVNINGQDVTDTIESEGDPKIQAQADTPAVRNASHTSLAENVENGVLKTSDDIPGSEDGAFKNSNDIPEGLKTHISDNKYENPLKEGLFADNEDEHNEDNPYDDENYIPGVRKEEGEAAAVRPSSAASDEARIKPSSAVSDEAEIKPSSAASDTAELRSAPVSSVSDSEGSREQAAGHDPAEITEGNEEQVNGQDPAKITESSEERSSDTKDPFKVFNNDTPAAVKYQNEIDKANNIEKAAANISSAGISAGSTQAGSISSTQENSISSTQGRSISKPMAGVYEPKVDLSAVQKKTEEPEKPRKPYVFPPVSLLSGDARQQTTADARALKETGITLVETLKSFGVNVSLGEVTRGPSITRYEILPQKGIRVNKITNLADDIKLALAVSNIRIEAPIPGKSAVGIEVPNEKADLVSFRELLGESFKNSKAAVPFAVGKDIYGNIIITDVARMPHLLIAGATGSGKSVCINTIIMSIIYRESPEDVKMIMIDPKVVELSVYNGIPHLFRPVVTDPKEAAAALNWAVAEMMNRYNLFKELGVRNIRGYNEKIKTDQKAADAGLKKMASLVIIVDEFADLMMVASKDVEDAVMRLAQLARAAGIHLVLATQRPSVNVITGVIKANIPSRIAFQVASQIDSRTILDMPGAERLIGKGDMLFYPSGSTEPTRLQGAFITDSDVEKVVDFLKEHNDPPEYDKSIDWSAESSDTGNGSSDPASNVDELFEQCARFVIESERASAGQLQRKFSIGFNRAGRILDQLCDYGIVGPSEGTKPRKILVDMQGLDEILTNMK
ncbi:MAG: DNA translocase FtsK [Lachnospiraceae bacterium]|nr:DNA translocase FtsK [Lachnospiraceae bacterium]MEE3461604.1 DNA translocase FtsK [Lachnospiraceae bacterium]